MNAITSNPNPEPIRGERVAAGAWEGVLAVIGPDLEAEGDVCDRENRFVARNLDVLESLGFFALGVPADLGGGGASYAEVCAMIRALAAWDGSTALALSMHSHQVAAAEWKRRNAGAPTEGLLRGVVDGARIVSSGGSDWLPGSGRAERVEGGYRIFARKVFSSGCPDGDVLSTSAIWDDPAEGPVVLHFSLPLKDRSIRIVETWDTLGMRGTGSHDVEIDGAFVADEAIAARRAPGKWHPMFHLISLMAMPLVYSVYAGLADAARAIAIASARGKPAETGMLLAVGDLENSHAALDLAHAALVACAAEAQPSPETTRRVMTYRGLVGRLALEVGSKALDCAGGVGFYRRHGLERRFRDLQAARFHPLQDRVQQLYAARMALGLGPDGDG